MAATAVLRSQDCLRHPLPHPHPHNETRGNTAVLPNANTTNTNPLRSRRRKRSPTGLASNGRDECRNRVPDRKDPVFSVKNLVMGQVKILKRGEPLPDKNNQQAETTPADKLGFVARDDEELILCSTDRLGPDPDMVQKQIRASDFYAGSGPIVASPHPSSLPFPALLAKKEKKSDTATMDLLRLLRLDLP